jgi:hypothetical protein
MSDRVPEPDLTADGLATRYVLSRVIGQGPLRRQGWALCRLLEQLAPDPAAIERPGEEGGWPSGPAPYERIGLREEEIDSRFEEIEPSACPLLDDATLDAGVPTILWPILDQLIADGPDIAFPAVKSALKRLAKHLAAGSIDNFRSAFLSLARELNELRKRETKLRPSPACGGKAAFGAWVLSDYPVLARAKKLGARPSSRDTSAPPRRFIRLLLKGLDWDVQQRIAAGDKGRFRALRARALIAVAILGMRPSAIARMVGSDVVEAFVFPDGVVGPAIYANPRKTVHESVTRPKAITGQVYEWIREYMEFAGVQPQGPLWLANRDPLKGLSGLTLSHLIVSLLDRPPDIEMRLNPYFRAVGDEWPTRRLSAGKFRHLAEGLGYDSGLDWINDHREEMASVFHTLPGDPQVFADALLDHGMGSLSARYKDAASEIGRARYGRVAALGAYGYILGERGAERSVDPVQLAETRERFVTARAREAAIATDIDQLERRLTSTDVRTLNAQERELYLLELAQSQITLLRLARELNAAGKETEKASVALERAKTTLVPIDDLAEAVPVESLVEQEAIADEPDLPILREFAWPEEFRRAIGENVLPPSTMRRWMSGKTPHPPGDRRNLIEPEAVETLSPRIRRIRLDRLDWTRFPESVQERLDAIRRTPDSRATRPLR